MGDPTDRVISAMGRCCRSERQRRATRQRGVSAFRVEVGLALGKLRRRWDSSAGRKEKNAMGPTRPYGSRSRPVRRAGHGIRKRPRGETKVTKSDGILFTIAISWACRSRIRIRRRPGAGRGPGSGRPNAPGSDRQGPPCVRRRTSAACGPPTTRGSVPRCSRSGTRQASVPDHGAFQNSTWSRNSRRIVPIRRSTNGCDSGTCGTVLISSISRIRRFAIHRCASNSGS